jgi:hypothetical protein
MVVVAAPAPAPIAPIPHSGGSGEANGWGRVTGAAAGGHGSSGQRSVGSGRASAR